MNYPQYGQPQYPPQQPQYPNPQQQWAQQYPQQPNPAMQWGQQQPLQQPAPVQLAQGSLDAFYSQPSMSSGPSWSWKDKPPGHTYVGVVARPLVSSDVQQETNPQGVPQFYRDGRPRFVMWIPVLVQPSPEFPDGRAVWPVKGQARDELSRAMAETGAPEGPPESGAGIVVTLTGRRPSRNGNNPSNQVAVKYTRPQGAPQQHDVSTYGQAPGTTTIPGAPQPTASAQLPNMAQPPQPTNPGIINAATGAPPVIQAAQQQPPQVAGQVMTGQPPQPPAGMSAEQAALLARLTGQPG